MKIPKASTMKLKTGRAVLAILLCSFIFITAGSVRADEGIDPCDFLPAGGDISTQRETTCIAQYASEPGVLVVQIDTVRLPGTASRQDCMLLRQDDDFRVYWNDVDYGDCGISAEVSYKGEPAPGYTGWMILYYFDRFTVRVATSQDYPANETRVRGLAGEVETKITNYLGQPQTEDEIISPDAPDEGSDDFYEPLPDPQDLPDWIQDGQAYIDEDTGIAIYVPDWLEWLKPEKLIRGRGTVIEPDGKIWVYNRALRKWKGPIRSDTALYTEDIIATGSSSSCRVVFRNPEGNQDTISVGGDTLLEIPGLPNDQPKSEYPNLWAIYKGVVKITHAIRGQSIKVEPASFVIHTPTIVVGTRGTEFVVSVDPEMQDTTVHLIEGELNYYNLAEGGTEDRVLTAGHTLVVFANGKEIISETNQEGLENLLAQHNLDDEGKLDQDTIEQGLSDQTSSQVGRTTQTESIFLMFCCCLLCMFVITVIIAVVFVILRARKNRQ